MNGSFAIRWGKHELHADVKFGKTEMKAANDATDTRKTKK